MRRRIVEFNSGRNKHGDHHGNRRKPDPDDNPVRNGSVTRVGTLQLAVDQAMRLDD